MPATMWEDIPRMQKCEECNSNYATHFYGSIWLCCECHAGAEGMLVEEARIYHEEGIEVLERSRNETPSTY